MRGERGCRYGLPVEVGVAQIAVAAVGWVAGWVAAVACAGGRQAGGRLEVAGLRREWAGGVAADQGRNNSAIYSCTAW